MGLTETRKKYLAKWREKNREHIREYNRKRRLKKGMDPNFYYGREEIEKLKRLYLRGVSLRRLGIMTKRDSQKMGEMLKRNGVKLRTHAEAQRLLRTGRLKKSGWRLQGWSERIKERDGKCTKCGSEKKLEGHHLVCKRDNPALMYEVSNGICLCHDCHLETDTYARKKKVELKVKL